MSFLRLGCFVLAILTILACGGTSVPPQTPEVVVATGSVGTQNALYKMNPDGTEIVKLTDLTIPAQWIRISPDKQKVVYVEGSRIKCARLDGTSVVTIAISGLSAFDSRPSWSSDSETVLFTHSEIVGSNSVSSLRYAKVSVPASVYSVVESADWSELSPTADTFVAIDSSVNGGRLFKMNLNGSGSTVLYTASRGEALQNPQWSPDGTKIIFQETSSMTLKIISPDGSSLMTPSASAWLPFYRTPMSAGNSFYLATPFTGSSPLVRVNVSSGDEEILASSTSNVLFNPVISPDGAKVMVSTNDSLLVLSTDGSSQQAIGGSVGARSGDWK